MEKLEPTWKLSEKLILENFKFLQLEFNFPKFNKKWIKDEYYILSRKNDIEFCCLIFQYSSNSPEIEIRIYSNVTETNYQIIDEIGKTNELKKIAENGTANIENYVQKCSELLRNKLNTLT